LRENLPVPTCVVVYGEGIQVRTAANSAFKVLVTGAVWSE